jgi:hypothetical protein
MAKKTQAHWLNTLRQIESCLKKETQTRIEALKALKFRVQVKKMGGPEALFNALWIHQD